MLTIESKVRAVVDDSIGIKDGEDKNQGKMNI